MLRRLLGSDGRSRAFVNDQAVGLGLLRRIGETLVEIHGQYENQRLLDPGEHRRLLDAFGGLAGEVRATAAAWQDWQAARAARAEAERALIAARRDEAFLRHAVEEIEALRPQPGEEAHLAGRRAMLMNAEKLIQALQDAMAELEPAAGRSVADALRAGAADPGTDRPEGRGAARPGHRHPRAGAVGRGGRDATRLAPCRRRRRSRSPPSGRHGRAAVRAAGARPQAFGRLR